MSVFPKTTIIDISALFEGTAPALERTIADVLVNERSFVATGFPQSADLDKRMRELLTFFQMHEQDKLACGTCKFRPTNTNIYRGFYPLPKKSPWSHNEIFDIGPEPAMSSPDVPGAESFRESNVWPCVEPYPGWRDAMLSTFAAKRTIGVVVMRAAARGLAIDEHEFVAPALGRNATFRLLHYAPLPAEFELTDKTGTEPKRFDDGRRLVASTHVDTGLISVLWQDQTGGLQMCGADDIWRDVAPLPNVLSIHLGDLVHGLSDSRLSGTPHRVIGDGSDRCSAGLFVEPDFDTKVIPPSGEPTVSYAQHLVNEFPERFERDAARS